MTRNNRKVLLKFFVATSLLALLPFGVARWRRAQPKTPYTFPFAELAALDKVVQARFAVVPGSDFGMTRVGPRHDYFKPVTPEESVAIAALRRAGFEVVFYVASRHHFQNDTGIGQPYVVQGPVYITPRAPINIVMTKPYSQSTAGP